MGYSRRILHYSPGPGDLVGALSERAVAGAWFQLHRQGGCGAGEVRLRDEFVEREAVAVGDWIGFEYSQGERWYLGRVEERQARSPAGVTLRLEGMGVELGEVFPGGFGRGVADGVPPHRYAQTDMFPNDPDYYDETIDTASQAIEVVRLLMEQYVVPRTHIVLDPALIEEPDLGAIVSMKFRGEESVRSIVKELALRSRNASWGVDAAGTFFFLQKRETVSATYREGREMILLEETRERDSLFNRILLTGDYVYDAPVNSDVTARGFYRWRGNYIQPSSRATYGERRIRLWVPWIRTQTDSREFAREFFRLYAEPAARYLVEVGNQSLLPKPWEGAIRLEARDGSEIVSATVETIRVEFDHAPRLRLEIGPEDPRIHWPEPPHDERWEVPGETPPGGLITWGTSLSSGESSGFTSDASSGDTSGGSFDSSGDSSGATSAGSSGLSSMASSDSGMPSNGESSGSSSVGSSESSGRSSGGSSVDSDGESSGSGLSSGSSGQSEDESGESGTSGLSGTSNGGESSGGNSGGGSSFSDGVTESGSGSSGTSEISSHGSEGGSGSTELSA